MAVQLHFFSKVALFFPRLDFLCPQLSGHIENLRRCMECTTVQCIGKMHVVNEKTMGCLMLLDLIFVVISEKHFRKGALEIEKYTILWIILF